MQTTSGPPRHLQDTNIHRENTFTQEKIRSTHNNMHIHTTHNSQKKKYNRDDVHEYNFFLNEQEMEQNKNKTKYNV